MPVPVPVSGRPVVRFSKLFRPFRPFRRREDGSVTVEFVLWMPILLLLISLTADAALLFGAKANVLRVVQDANRAASIGRLGTDLGDMTTGARNYVRTNIGYMATNATITSQIVNGNVISTTVVIPSNDLIANGFLGRLTNINITINAQHLLEI